MPKSGSAFENRLSLPEAWRGLRDQELSKLSGIEDCIFVRITNLHFTTRGEGRGEGGCAMALSVSWHCFFYMIR